MLFNSYIFIFAFLPLCLLGFYCLKSRSQTMAKIWLTGFSLWFYGYFNPIYLLIMVFSILFNFGMYQWMTKRQNGKESKTTNLNEIARRKRIVTIGIVVNLAVLFYFKYYDFFIGNVNAIFGSSFALKHLLLPLGISFFTFQQISFLLDAYRGEIENCGFIDYALFVSFFPQLIAGPIVTHDEMLPQFQAIGRKIEAEDISKSVYLFVLGMSKKVLIADTFGLAVDKGYGMIAQLGSIDAILVMLFYTLQLYFDFSGYCDMAIGLGGMLGIRIPLNFRSPYKAANIIEFWKRWHMTLSRFFTKNLYIPLGGNRKGVVRMYCNLWIVFFLSGLWHGAGWNFIVWGIMHGTLYCLTRMFQNRKRDSVSHSKKLGWKHGLGVMATFLYVNIAWVFFRSTSIGEAVELFKRMFTGGITIPLKEIADCFNLKEFWYVIKVLHLADFVWSPYIVMVIFTMLVLSMTFFGKNVHEIVEKCKYNWASAVCCAILFVWCVVSLSGVSTFLYFNF